MVNRSAAWFRAVAIGGGVVSLLMVPLVELLLHGDLALWLHIPLTGLVLTLMAGGAAVAGIAWLEYKARSLADRQEA